MSRTTLASAALAVAALVAPSASRAQAIFDTKAVTEIRSQYLADLDTVRSKVMALANAIPEASYQWRPSPATRSVSEALMHVATEWYFYAPAIIGGKAPADFGVPRETIPKMEKIAAKAEVLAHLDKAWAHCRAQVEGIDPATLTGRYRVFGRETTLPQAILLMSGDLHEHLGQLITYARSLGVTPPWSK
jgi:uncharacterized damage-inducible protein DinB